MPSDSGKALFPLSPLLRGEGWGEGLLFPRANASIAVPPYPHRIFDAIRPLPAGGGEVKGHGHAF